MNLANFLTLSRFGLGALFVWLVFADGTGADCLALVVFLTGCATDYLDGKVARRLKEITPMGQFLDPVADKVLNYGAFTAFAALSLVPWWIVGVMLTREIFVTLVRITGMKSGVAVSAESLGKLKTIAQDSAIVGILIYIILSGLKIWPDEWTGVARGGILAAMLGVLTLTLLSGISYVQGHFRRLYETVR